MKIVSEVDMIKTIGILLLSAICIFTLASCSRTGSRGGINRSGDESVKSYNDTEWLNGDPYISDLDTKDFTVASYSKDFANISVTLKDG